MCTRVPLLADGFGFNNNGRFGVINLRGPGPICPQCTGIAGEWHPQFVYTDFEFDIIHQPSGQLLNVAGGFKTYLTFYGAPSADPPPPMCHSLLCCRWVLVTSGVFVVMGLVLCTRTSNRWL